ncbi:MAG: hypothetical protein ACRDBP_19065 [Luteolibacter sp.]
MEAVEPDHLPPESFWSQPGRFPCPDWEWIADQVEIRDEQAFLNETWNGVAAQWLGLFADVLGTEYRLYASENFIIVTQAAPSRVKEVVEFLEYCHAEILRSLPFINASELYGKCAVIVFGNEQEFYEYLSAFCPDDRDQGLAGGVFLNQGYGHFILPSENLDRYRAVMCHELCHSLLSGFDLPLWLNEAITGEVEHLIVGGNPYFLDREMVREHQAYWTPDLIQSFWTGESFSFPDEGQQHSYHLARFIFNALTSYSNPETMAGFVSSVTHKDAGFSAASDHFGVHPGEILTDFLGEGDWNCPGIPENGDA